MDQLVRNYLRDATFQSGPSSSHGDIESSNAGSPCSNLQMEVISGPSTGVRISSQSKKNSSHFLTVGRVQQNDLVINDPEVSGKHALVTWNSKHSKWELVDMGSLNGTIINDRFVAAIPTPNMPATRQRSPPVGLVNGDVVTLGSGSKILVSILSSTTNPNLTFTSAPFEVGVATDPMTIRRGGKQLPMEDVVVAEWPLRGLQEFGVFCIFDGHGGAASAEAASRLMPQKLSEILSDQGKRSRIMNECDATDILEDAFRKTEQSLTNEYEGCTATVLLIWSKGKDYYVQCGNLGDSACVVRIEEQVIQLTEDHRLTSEPERSRLSKMGRHLKDNETRIYGMNIARALGDKFLKEQERCFSSLPYISQVLKLDPESQPLVLIASDGLWDVIAPRQALNAAMKARNGNSEIEGRKIPPQNAEGIADMLLNRARELRTKDNTTVVVLSFSPSRPRTL